jgi:hypothetical protein
MKTTKLLLVTILVVIATGLNAENIFFPTKEGAVLTFVQKDGSGTITGYTRQTITKVEGSSDNMTISYVYESMDENKNVVVSVLCEMVVKDAMTIFDKKHVFIGQLKSSNEKIVDVTGTPLKFPNNLAVGQSISDAHLNMTLRKGIITVHVTVDMTNGKCVATEIIKTPAGTFNSLKITQDIATAISIASTDHTHAISWGTAGIGIVKSDTYNSDGSLKNSLELIEIK